MRIAVLGAGGVGGYFGGRLAQAGEEVVFIARGAHLQAISERGLRVESLKGDFTIYPAQVSDDPFQVGLVDAVLVAVKAWQVPEAADEIRAMVGSQTIVVPLENGVDAPIQLAASLDQQPGEHVLGGLCHIVSQIAAPGIIRHTGLEPHIAFGELDRRSSSRAERLRQAFEAAGVWAEVPADIQVAMWEKFIFIATISGIGAVTGAPAGIWRRVDETRQIMQRALEEVLAVGLAQGVALRSSVVEETLAFIDQLPEGATASMQRDILNGRPSELESQNGAVVRLGRQSGIPTPVHEMLYASLLPRELRARGNLSF